MDDHESTKTEPILLFAPTMASLSQGQNSSALVRHLFRISETLRNPMRISIDAADGVYVFDTALGKIVRFDSTRQFVESANQSGCRRRDAVDQHEIGILSDQL